MTQAAVLLVIAASLASMMVRPFGVSEAVPVLVGAALLVVFGVLTPFAAVQAVGQGVEVYFFLIGMMLLAELALLQGVFAWAAARLLQMAQGSAVKLFALIYALAVIITVLLSNDATAVVFTPAVAAIAAAAKIAEPLPYLLICAFVANAASFVLPISNPANLVLFGHEMPRLDVWFKLFGLASVLSIMVTYVMLWLTQRRVVCGTVELPKTMPELTQGGRWTLAGLSGTAVILVLAAWFGWPLGVVTFGLAVGCLGLVWLLGGQHPRPVLLGVSWSILPLVAGLFIMVGALDSIGVMSKAKSFTHEELLPIGAGVALLTNVANNLPIGLLASHLFPGGALVRRAVALIGVDLGPNLSVTGSLATILWMNALRRQGLSMSGWRFLGLGMVLMPPALLVAIGGLWLIN
ncbi:MAG: anion permease [Rhodospirillales bacterium]|nr:anion permease [Rhodospirillales bacterium]MDE2457726.1 anion permease [Rhodospirillales bacterium]